MSKLYVQCNFSFSKPPKAFFPPVSFSLPEPGCLGQVSWWQSIRMTPTMAAFPRGHRASSPLDRRCPGHHQHYCPVLSCVPYMASRVFGPPAPSSAVSSLCPTGSTSPPHTHTPPCIPHTPSLPSIPLHHTGPVCSDYSSSNLQLWYEFVARSFSTTIQLREFLKRDYFEQ